MRNVEKIKRLEHEIGRYQKKVTDQSNEERALRVELDAAHAGNRETQMAVDAMLTAIVLEHGVVAEDPDTGEAIGWRLTVPRFSVAELRERYEIHARHDENPLICVLGVAVRELPDDPA